MRTPTDLPRRRPRPAKSRVGLAVTGAILLFLGLSVRGFAGFYTDYLWFGELRLHEVWRSVLGAKILLAVLFTVVFFLGMWLSLTIADRLAPPFRATGPEDELVQRYRDAIGERTGLVRIIVSALFALIAGLGMSSQWNNWILFQHASSFGQKDPQFHKDIGFFVFRLPFINAVVSWLFVAVLIITFVTAMAHYLNGGIRLQSQLGRVTPRVKAHLSVLLGLLALVKAAAYWFQRYSLSTSTRGFRDGPGYTDVHAQLPALLLLTFISLAAAALLLVNINRQGWMLPGLAVGLWALVAVIVGGIYPATIQQFTVKPNEPVREAPYVKRNIAATRAALKLDKVKTTSFNYSEKLTATDLVNNADTIRNVRLWDPSYVVKTYRNLQENKSYYQIPDVDIDRYLVDGKPTQAVVAARELDSNNLPGGPSWVNQHLQYTHGFGAVVAPANAVTAEGQPDFSLKDVPPTGTPTLTQPRIYYGEGAGDYSIVKTGQPELDFQDPSGANKASSYQGTGGVPLNSPMRRAAFALRFWDYNMVVSKDIKPSSRVIFTRNIADRVRKAAPFLKLDYDPYPVILNGKIFWVQDAYTTTSRYPYAQRTDTDRLPTNSGLRTPFNYVRNSVKIVIDAYNGSLTFYAFDGTDPILRSYQKAFPSMFQPASQMSKELRDHLRYPEDLFRVQTNMYGRYHITDPRAFYSAGDAWDISQDPGNGALSGQASSNTPTSSVNAAGQVVVSNKAARMDPTYLLLRLPGDEAANFLILQPFVPTSAGDKQQILTAFMTAKSDPGTYGELEVFVTPRGQRIDGPSLVNATINATPSISQELSLLNTQGSQVLFGNELVLPIEQSLLYVRPLYVSAQKTDLPELRKVIVVYAGKAIMKDTLQEALTNLFGNAPPTLEQKGAGGTPTTVGPTVAPNLASLLAQIQAAYNDAQAALKVGDLGTYQKRINDMGALISQAQAQSAGSGSSPSSTTTTTTRPTA
jgi:uncharacterized membrane protein (UPF0182 family)